MIANWDVRTAARNLNINLVPYDTSLRGYARAYSEHRELAVDPQERFPVLAALHEMGHIVLGHTSQPNWLYTARQQRRHEVEAHWIAIGVAHRLGLAIGQEWEPNEERAYLTMFGGTQGISFSQMETAINLITEAGMRTTRSVAGRLSGDTVAA